MANRLAVLISGRLQVVRYLLSSGVSFLTDLAVFAFAYQKLGIVTAMLLARLVGGIVAYSSHKWFSFLSRTRPSLGEVVKIAGLWLVNYLVATAVVMAFSGEGGLLIVGAKVATEIIVYAANFLLLRRIFVAG